MVFGEEGEREGGGGGADLCLARKCLSNCAHSCKLTKTDRRQCASPFGWTVQPETPHACSLRRQVPGVPSAKLTQHQGEEKDCEARPTSSPSPTEEGRRNLLHLLGVGCLWIRNEMRSCSWTSLPGKPDPFTTITTCIQKMTRSNRRPFTTPITYPG